jgi:quinol monooxygenase YgiN
MIHVLAEIRLAPGARERFAAEFHRVGPFVRAEDGCIEYVGAVDVPTAIALQAPVRDDLFMVIEKWESEAALALHLSAPHMEVHRANARGLVTSTTIHILASA